MARDHFYLSPQLHQPVPLDLSLKTFCEYHKLQTCIWQVPGDVPSLLWCYGTLFFSS